MTHNGADKTSVKVKMRFKDADGEFRQPGDLY